MPLAITMVGTGKGNSSMIGGTTRRSSRAPYDTVL